MMMMMEVIRMIIITTTKKVVITIAIRHMTLEASMKMNRNENDVIYNQDEYKNWDEQ